MSSTPSGKKPPLLDEQLALGEYLDALLSEPAAPEPAAYLRPVRPESDERPTMPQEARVLPREIPVAPPPVAQPVEVAKVEVEVQAAVVESVSPMPAADYPEWSEGSFQSLLFKVAGLTLAVPLVKLNGVLTWSDKITPMPGHSSHFMGLLQHLDHNVKVIDTAGIIVPPERLRANGERHYGNIILIGNGEWGLACDHVEEVITLNRDDVRWRTAQGKRAWLAGTVIEQMCALLNTDGLVRQLETGEF